MRGILPNGCTWDTGIWTWEMPKNGATFCLKTAACSRSEHGVDVNGCEPTATEITCSKCEAGNIAFQVRTAVANFSVYQWEIQKHDSSVAAMMEYELDSQGSISGRNKRFFSNSQRPDRFGAHTTPYTIGKEGLFPREKSGRGVKLTCDLHLLRSSEV
jgi:hypothetical protein